MPRPDLKLIEGGGGYVTLTRVLRYLGAYTCLVEIVANPLQRRWLPASCIVSQAPTVGEEVTLRVPLAVAIDQGLVQRGANMMVGGDRLTVVAPARAEDRITL